METGLILFTFDKLLIVVGVHLFITSVSTLGVSVTIDSLILELEIVLNNTCSGNCSTSIFGVEIGIVERVKQTFFTKRKDERSTHFSERYS